MVRFYSVIYSVFGFLILTEWSDFMGFLRMMSCVKLAFYGAKYSSKHSEYGYITGIHREKVVTLKLSWYHKRSEKTTH